MIHNFAGLFCQAPDELFAGNQQLLYSLYRFV